MRNHLFVLLSVFSLFISESQAEGDTKHPKKVEWSFKGPAGSFDRAALQRGFQVYKEVCSACHAVEQLRYGSLAGRGKDIHEIRTSNLGITKDEAKAIAADYKIPDTDDDGQPKDRAARLTDKFVHPYPNEKAARAANNGAAPVDLSMVVKARKGEADYVYSILTGYGEKAPEGTEIGEGRYYNPYFPGGQISMTAPIHTDGQVTYADGTKATVDQMARDVVTFLAWASEPDMEDRKQMGMKVMFYLFFLTIVFYMAKRRVWAKLH